MSWVATAIVGGTVVGGYLTSEAMKESGETAAEAQIEGSQLASTAELEATKLSIEEQRRQFDEIQTLLSPYVEAGETALSQQLNLIGLGGPEAQASAISGLEQSPQYQALIESGEEALLQNASATGGLRGGNVQAALAEYRPSVLSQLIENQYSKLSGVTGMGQASSVGTASAGQTSASNISNLLQSMGSSQAANFMNAGSARAQSSLLTGQARAGMYSDIAGSIPLAIYAGKKF